MIVAAIPVKRLGDAKSRLAPALSGEERAALMVRLLERTVMAVRESGAVDRIVLVTSEADLGPQLGLETLPDTGTLNGSLRAAARWAVGVGASALLVMPADLPFVEAAEIRRVVAAGEGEPSVVVAATEDGGTAALLLTPPVVIPPAFGEDSGRRHARLARERDVPVRLVSSDTLAFDLDTEADLLRYRALVSPSPAGPDYPVSSRLNQ